MNFAPSSGCTQRSITYQEKIHLERVRFYLAHPQPNHNLKQELKKQTKKNNPTIQPKQNKWNLKQERKEK